MARRDAVWCAKRRQEIKKWDDSWKTNRDQYYKFFDFVMGMQWEDEESKLFYDYGKTALTANKVGPLANHIIGEQCESTPNMQAVPGDNVQEETAAVRQDLIKDICLSSRANEVYQTVFNQAIVGGFGAMRNGTQYIDRLSFHQEPTYEEIRDPCRAYWSLDAKNKSKTDSSISGYRERLTRKSLKELVGEKIERKIGSAASEDDIMSFTGEDAVTVTNDYERESNLETVYQMSNGKILRQKELDKLEKITVEDKEYYLMNGEQVNIEQEKEEYFYSVKFRRFVGDYIIEEKDFPSEQSPIIFVDQNSYYDKNGKQICRPFFKDVYDAQRFLNYIFTQTAYLLKITRYDRFIVPKSCVRSPDTQLIWRDPKNVQGGLIYDESTSGAKPEELKAPELPQSLLQQYERALNDIQSSVGMYGSQLGDQGNENSGVAIKARSNNASYAVKRAKVSLERAMVTSGEIINEMIPKLYDTERTVMINRKDSGLTPVTLNQQMDEYGALDKKYDMTTGNYKIRLLPGPSYEGQKELLLESLQAVLKADPQLFQIIGDLYVENLPAANNIELRNRIRTIIPPEIIQAGKTGQPVPPKPQQPDPQTIAAMAEAKNKEKLTEIKGRELQLKSQEMQMQFQLEYAKLEAEKEEAAAELQEVMLRFHAETHKTNTDANIAHADNLVKILTHSPKFEQPQENKS